MKKKRESLVGKLFIGSCPIHGVEMKVNKQDHWECSTCGLQIRTTICVTVLPDKGKGEFKKPLAYASNHLQVGQDLTIREDFRT